MKENSKASVTKTSIIIFFWLFVYTVIALIFVYFTHNRQFMLDTDSKVITTDIPTIVIDAGHGGIDGGAVSEDGVSEKDINLKIALKLKALLTLSEIPCILTREDDCEVEFGEKHSSSRKRADLIARTEICNSIDNPVFVSIHQNKFPSGRYKGLQVFYSKNNPESFLLAQIVKQNNKELIDSNNNREIKPAGREIYVLDNLETPAILIECGFLSNAAETKLLSSDEYQTKLALMIYSSISQYIYKV